LFARNITEDLAPMDGAPPRKSQLGSVLFFVILTFPLSHFRDIQETNGPRVGEKASFVTIGSRMADSSSSREGGAEDDGIQVVEG
jgi:hypothetical protein